MEDYKIVDLYWERSERAISETKNKYENMLSRISFSLLNSKEDAEECVNDTYLSAWKQMPEDRPVYLGAYLAKIVRAISIGRFRSKHRQKRGGMDNLTLELCECIPDGCDLQSEYENGRLAELINRFIGGLPDEKRIIFVRRYFYSQSIEEIARGLGIGNSKVKTTLFRLREQLRQILEKEDML